MDQVRKDYSYLEHGQTKIRSKDYGDKVEIDLNFYEDSLNKMEEAEREAERIVRNLDLKSKKASEKVLLIHDHLGKVAKYNLVGEENNSLTEDDYSAYGILIKNLGIGEGYAKAFQLIGERAGLRTAYVEGTYKGEDHRWNMVYLDGDWYNLDISNATRPYENKKKVFTLVYDYFLKADKDYKGDYEKNIQINYPRAGGKKDYYEELGISYKDIYGNTYKNIGNYGELEKELRVGILFDENIYICLRAGLAYMPKEALEDLVEEYSKIKPNTSYKVIENHRGLFEIIKR